MLYLISVDVVWYARNWCRRLGKAHNIQTLHKVSLILF